MNYCPAKQRVWVFIFITLFGWFSQHLPGAARACVRMEVGRGSVVGLGGLAMMLCREQTPVSAQIFMFWPLSHLDEGGDCGQPRLLHHHTDLGLCCRICCKMHSQTKDFASFSKDSGLCQLRGWNPTLLICSL